MSKKDIYNELLSLKAMAKMIVKDADRLIEKMERPVSTRISKNKKKTKLDEAWEKHLIRRKKTQIRQGLRYKAMQEQQANNKNQKPINR